MLDLHTHVCGIVLHVNAGSLCRLSRKVHASLHKRPCRIFTDCLQGWCGRSCKASMHDYPIKVGLRRSWLLWPSAGRVTYVWLLHDTKCFALEPLLCSLTLIRHFPSAVIDCHSCKDQDYVQSVMEEHGLGRELTLSWVGTATWFQATVLQHHSYLTAGTFAYIHECQMEKSISLTRVSLES